VLDFRGEGGTPRTRRSSIQPGGYAPKRARYSDNEDVPGYADAFMGAGAKAIAGMKTHC
jgi:hypothetical protein